MEDWIGTRDYNKWLEQARQASTEELIEHVNCDVYCIALLFGQHPPVSFDWIIVWNAYIELKVELDELDEKGIYNYSTKMAENAMLARLKEALDELREKGRESRIARKLARLHKLAKLHKLNSASIPPT